MDSISADISAAEFFTKCISRRTPILIKGLPDDESFKARAWVSDGCCVLRQTQTKLPKVDLDYLAERAGDSEVLVEPMHPASNQFGTDVERVTMSFREFLSSLRTVDGPHHYLTTQYADQDSDEQIVLPPPADALAGDYPQVPRLMGNLCLQQVNLWLGRSKDGSTSGLVCLFQTHAPSIETEPVYFSTTTFTITCTAFSEAGSVSYCIHPRRSRTCIHMVLWILCTRTT